MTARATLKPLAPASAASFLAMAVSLSAAILRLTAVGRLQCQRTHLEGITHAFVDSCTQWCKEHLYDRYLGALAIVDPGRTL